MTAPIDVINQGSKHKGHRHEEMILQQQEGLRDVKERISALQKKWPSSESYEPILKLIVVAKLCFTNIHI